MSSDFYCSTKIDFFILQTGVKLILESSEEEFSLVMLVSLSEIASKWTPLIPRQVYILLILFDLHLF